MHRGARAVHRVLLLLVVLVIDVGHCVDPVIASEEWHRGPTWCTYATCETPAFLPWAPGGQWAKITRACVQDVAPHATTPTDAINITVWTADQTANYAEDMQITVLINPGGMVIENRPIVVTPVRTTHVFSFALSQVRHVRLESGASMSEHRIFYEIEFFQKQSLPPGQTCNGGSRALCTAGAGYDSSNCGLPFAPPLPPDPPPPSPPSCPPPPLPPPEQLVSIAALAVGGGVLIAALGAAVCALRRRRRPTTAAPRELPLPEAFEVQQPDGKPALAVGVGA